MNELYSDFNFEDIEPLLGNSITSILGKFNYETSIPRQALLERNENYIKKLLEMEILRIALRDAGHTVRAAVLTRRAEYDSKHFDVNVGKIELAVFDTAMDVQERRRLFRELKDKASSEDIEVLFARIGLDQFRTIQALEKEDGMITDILLTYRADPKLESKINYSLPNAKIEEARTEDSQALAEISRKIFRTNHFHSDPYLSRSKSDELYARWVCSRLKGKDDKVLVVRKNGEVLGFITCTVEHVGDRYDYGVVDLIGVRDEHVGRGIGLALVGKALEWFSVFTKAVYVGTQAVNVTAVRLYERAGFRQVYSEIDMHLWI